VRRGVVLRHDVPAVVAALRAGGEVDLAPRETVLDVYYRLGAENFVRTTNHEQIVNYLGLTGADVPDVSQT
jgi:hypothetical protein